MIMTIVTIVPLRLKYRCKVNITVQILQPRNTHMYMRSKLHRIVFHKTACYRCLSRLKKCCLSLSRARYRCEMLFFVSFDISANVSSNEVGWKQGSQPKSLHPRGLTISPSVLPSNSSILSSGLPLLYTNVHRAYADLSSKPASSLCRPA